MIQSWWLLHGLRNTFRKPLSVNTANLKWSEAKWKTAMLSDRLKFEIIFGNYGRHIDCLWTIRLVISAQFQSPHLWWYGVVLVPVEVVMCTSGKTPSMLKGIQVLDKVFFRNGLAYLGKTMHPVSITTALHCGRRVQLPDCPACTADLSVVDYIKLCK